MNAKKKALGRGLGALIDDAIEEKEIPKTSAPIDEVPISDIETNPYQPRTQFDEEALNELAASIKELGIIQPITLRESNNGKFQLISGERRFRAAQIAGLNTITAYIRQANDQEMLEMALVENIQREDLDSIEIAISYQRLMDECKLTQETLSARVGKKRSTVTNYLRLLKLPAEIQLGIRNRAISMGHARALINIENKNDQLKIFDKVLKEELSVRKTEELVRDSGKTKSTSKKNNEVLPESYDQLKKQLSGKLKTDVDFMINNKGRGKIVIPFKSSEELEKIIGIFERLNS